MNRKPLEGTTIGRWKVISYAGCKGKKAYYTCQCMDCGEIYIRRSDKLSSGATNRCRKCSQKKRAETEL